MDVDVLVEKCQKVYFPVDGYSSADFITVHAALLTIVRTSSEPEFRQLELTPKEVQETISLCQRNVGIALEQTSLFLHPCLDNIVALAHGVSPCSRSKSIHSHCTGPGDTGRIQTVHGLDVNLNGRPALRRCWAS